MFKKITPFLFSVLHFSKIVFKKLIIFLGYVFFIIIVLSFTDIPYYAYHYLGIANTIKITKPQLIVLLSGNSMPSPDGFLRCYYTAQIAKNNSQAKIVIAFPFDKNNIQEIKFIKNELVMRGVDSTIMNYEYLGFNTHSQAENIAAKYNHNLTVSIITSPEHMYRAIGTFRKAGFKYVTGMPTFDKPLEEETITDKEKSKDVRVKSLNLRYNMWSYLNYELIVIREYCAITYYKLKGWI